MPVTSNQQVIFAILISWRVVRAVEGARLESVYTPKGYRGFESLTLRKTSNVPALCGEFLFSACVLDGLVNEYINACQDVQEVKTTEHHEIFFPHLRSWRRRLPPQKYFLPPLISRRPALNSCSHSFFPERE